MPIEQFHLDQYKMLREEIMQNILETYHAELLVAGAVGAIYAWLWTTWLWTIKPKGNERAICYVPPVIIFFGALRCLMLTVQNQVIAGYLSRIEEAAFGANVRLPGWERFLSSGSGGPVTRWSYAAGIAWFLAFIGASVVSWRLAKDTLSNPTPTPSAMPDDHTPSPSPTPIGDTSSGLAVGLALGVGFGTLINNLAAGIGTGIAIGAACAIARRKGSRRWVLWLGLYAVTVLVAFVLKLAGVLK